MNIRVFCPLCNNDAKTKHILSVDQDFIDFIDRYYGNESFEKLSKYIDSDITYSQCNNCQLIYQKNIHFPRDKPTKIILSNNSQHSKVKSFGPAAQCL